MNWLASPDAGAGQFFYSDHRNCACRFIDPLA